MEDSGVAAVDDTTVGAPQPMTLTLTQRLAALDITDERGGGDTITTQ